MRPFAMPDSQATCIYCRNPVILSQGEGDYVIPDAFGRFQGQFIFRRICRSCNNLIGKCEEQLLRCAPEAFFRRLVQPSVKRNKRGKAWVGANGMPPPEFTIKRGDHQEVVRASTENPRNTEAIDQLVLVDKDKGEQHIQLVPDMSAAHLRARIAGLTPSGNVYLHCDEGAFQRYAALLKEIFPHSQFTERESDEAGVHQVRGRMSFTFHNDYWRAIAKIGLHYYLCNSRRGIRGDEPEFADIRRFVIEGGDHEPFFTNPAAQFALPFGEMPNGGAILPSDWAHVLAADESGQAVVAMVSLFVGPQHLAPERHINLGRFQTPLIVPDARCVHAYMYDAEPAKSQYAGHVLTMTITRLR